MSTIGCHLSIKRGFMGMALQTISLHASTFQFFTHNPRRGDARTWGDSDISSFIEYAERHDMGPIVGYGPYVENPASADERISAYARQLISDDLDHMEQIPNQLYIMHPGSATNEPDQEGIDNVVSVVNDCVSASQTTTLCIVNTAGAGHEVAGSFEEMARILSGVTESSHVGTCFDVAAAWGAGYDVKDGFDAVLDEYDDVIGLDRMRVVHLADPRYGLGTHHAHHMPIGKGALGIEALKAIYTHPRLADKVFILETPDGDIHVYEAALKALRR